MIEYDVPRDADVHRCQYCDRPFETADLLALHHGFDHPDAIDEDELAAFEAAYGEETDEIKHYRLVALGVLVLLYFGLLMTYALV